MTVAAILSTKGGDVLTIESGTLVREAVTMLADRRIGALPVVRDGAVVGIMSERDVIYRLRSDGAAVLDWAVERIMTAPAIAVQPDHDIMGALSLMTKRRIRHLPVLDGDRIVGIVSIGDVVKFRLGEMEQESSALRDYILTA